MKNLITILTMLASINAFAGTTSYSGSLRVKSTVSEADMVLKAEALIPGIVNFTNKEIRREAGRNRCHGRSPRYITMQSLRVSKAYTSVDGETFEPVFYGSIGYVIRNCRDRD